jgi:excisionase family DNA binding protein
MSVTPSQTWMPSPALWTIPQAAVYLNCSVSTIKNLIRCGELVRRKVGAKTLVPRTSLEAFLRKDHPTK